MVGLMFIQKLFKVYSKLIWGWFRVYLRAYLRQVQNFRVYLRLVWLVQGLFGVGQWFVQRHLGWIDLQGWFSVDLRLVQSLLWVCLRSIQGCFKVCLGFTSGLFGVGLVFIQGVVRVSLVFVQGWFSGDSRFVWGLFKVGLTLVQGWFRVYLGLL